MHITIRTLSVLARYALSIGLLWLLVNQVDMKVSWAAVKEISPIILATVLILEVMQIAIVTFRWKFVVQSIGAKISFSLALKLLSIGMFLGQILPGAVGGDVVRVWKTRQAGLSVSASINSVLLERIATILGLMLLLIFTVPMVISKYYKAPFSIWVFPALIVGSIIVIGSLMLLDRIPKYYDRFMVIHHLSVLANDTRLLFLQPKKALWLMVLVFLGHTNLCVQVWVLALGLGLPLTIFDSLILVPPVLLLAYLPIALGGWGVREFAMVAALGLADVSSSQSLLISLLFGLVGLTMSLPGLVFWMQTKHESARTLHKKIAFLGRIG
jgi:glycosyltransferase 2 family protein